MNKNTLYIFNGYCDKISYNTNEIVHVYADGNDDFENININITNLEGKIVKNVFVKEIKKQINKYYGLPNSDYWSGHNVDFKNKINESPWEDFCYDKSFSFDIKGFKSGIYLIGKKIKFIVKADSKCEITYLYSSNTEAAYNGAGGKSLYYDWQGDSPSDPKKALVVGFKRPVMFTPKYDNNCEFGEVIDVHQRAILDWLIKQDYNINYICDLDMDELTNINETKVLIIGGHSEYWTMKARNNLETIISNGTNILSLSGNSIWWRVEYADNNSKIVCIRDKKNINLLNSEIKKQNDFSNTIKYCKLRNNNNEKMMPFSIFGVDYIIGGYGKYNSTTSLPYYNVIIDENNPILNNIKNDKIYLNYQEFDGIYTNIRNINEVNYIPASNQINIENKDNLKLNEKLYSIFKFKKLIMAGICEYPSDNGVIKRFSGIIAVRKNDTAGIVLNTCCMDWCHSVCFDSQESGDDIKIITKNCIDTLLNNPASVFISSSNNRGANENGAIPPPLISMTSRITALEKSYRTLREDLNYTTKYVLNRLRY